VEEIKNDQILDDWHPIVNIPYWLKAEVTGN